jgi:hypothetical protein
MWLARIPDSLVSEGGMVDPTPFPKFAVFHKTFACFSEAIED